MYGNNQILIYVQIIVSLIEPYLRNMFCSMDIFLLKNKSQ